MKKERNRVCPRWVQVLLTWCDNIGGIPLFVFGTLGYLDAAALIFTLIVEKYFVVPLIIGGIMIGVGLSFFFVDIIVEIIADRFGK